MDGDIEIPEEVRKRYIERRKSDLQTLDSALNVRGFDEFKRIGHQLKGNAASFGYNDLEKIAVQLEKAGRDEDTIEATRLLGLFRGWLEQVAGTN